MTEELNITLSDREMSALRNFTEANGIDMAQYAKDAILDKLNIDRYGDMNEMIKKTKPKTTRKRTVKAEEPAAEEVKPKEEPAVEPSPVVEEKVEETQTKRKRVLKVKKMKN